MSDIIYETTPEERQLCRIVARKVLDYLKDPEHRRDFEQWYEAKYGKPYVWEHPADENEKVP